MSRMLGFKTSFWLIVNSLKAFFYIYKKFGIWANIYKNLKFELYTFILKKCIIYQVM